MHEIKMDKSGRERQWQEKKSYIQKRKMKDIS